jgi:hypothetical protein
MLVATLVAPSSAVARKVLIGLLERAGEHEIAVSADTRTERFVLTRATILPRNGLRTGEKVRVFFVEADVKVAIEIEELRK